jgi:hypothetical protein
MCVGRLLKQRHQQTQKLVGSHGSAVDPTVVQSVLVLRPSVAGNERIERARAGAPGTDPVNARARPVYDRDAHETCS